MILQANPENEKCRYILNTDFSYKDFYVTEIGYSIPKQGSQLLPQFRKTFTIHIIIEGNGVFNGMPVKSGDGFIMFPGQRAWFETGESYWEHCWIQFGGKLAEEFIKPIFKKQVCQVIKLKNASALACEFKKYFDMDADNINEHNLISLLFAVLGDIKKDTEKPCKNECVALAVKYIENNFEKDINVKSVAQAVGICEKYLWRIFKEYTSVSPQQFIIETRLSYAEKLIRENNIKINEAALAVGYPSVQSFLKIYKKYRKKNTDRI